MDAPGQKYHKEEKWSRAILTCADKVVTGERRHRSWNLSHRLYTGEERST
jgi:hypothetical protein